MTIRDLTDPKLILCVNIFTVFICSFMFLAPIFGYLGDRYDRKLIMIAGLTVWIVTTLGSSFVKKSVQYKVFMGGLTTLMCNLFNFVPVLLNNIFILLYLTMLK